MHPQARDYVAQAVAEHGPFPSVLEVGSRYINGGVRDLFDGDYTGIDYADGPGVDKVADGATYKHPGKVDCVVCCEVLEHTESAPKIVRNAHRNLKAGGVLIVTTATDPRLPHSASDGGALGDGEFYRNVSKRQLQAWLKDFTTVDIDVQLEHGDIRATAIK